MMTIPSTTAKGPGSYEPWWRPEDLALPPLPQDEAPRANSSLFSRIQAYFCAANRKSSIRRKVLLGITLGAVAITTIGIIAYKHFFAKHTLHSPIETTPLPFQTTASPINTAPSPVDITRLNCKPINKPIEMGFNSVFLTSYCNNCSAIQPDCVETGRCVDLGARVERDGWPEKILLCGGVNFLSIGSCNTRSSLLECGCTSSVTGVSSPNNCASSGKLYALSDCCHVSGAPLK